MRNADRIAVRLGYVAMKLIARAERSVWDGRDLAPLHQHRAVVAPLGISLIFTRDVGHHSGGWWKNPDYERCRHLSIATLPESFVEQALRQMGKERLADRSDFETPAFKRLLLEAFFGAAARYAWSEPPRYAQGIAQNTWHYRVFCDERWAPLLPRGEVYSRELTEAGWKSTSELYAAELDVASQRQSTGGSP